MSDLTTNFRRRIDGKTARSLFPGVPQPTPEVQSLYRCLDALKQGYEQLVRARGRLDDSAVRVSDLEDFAAEVQSAIDQVSSDASDASVTEELAQQSLVLQSLQTAVSNIANQSPTENTTIINNTEVSPPTWLDYVARWGAAPTIEFTGPDGDVWKYVYADGYTVYRYITNSPYSDTIYEDYVGGVLYNKLTERQTAL